MNVEGEAAIATRRAQRSPVVYMAFDLLHLDGRSLLELPYEQRRAAAGRSSASRGPRWRTPRSHRGGGAGAAATATREQGLEGIVAKRLDSRYEPGPPQRRLAQAAQPPPPGARDRRLDGRGGRRAGRVGALLLGVRERPGGPLRYAGRVGSGFTEAHARRARAAADAAATQTRSPFARGRRRAAARRALRRAASCVAEVEFSDWTREGLVRQSVFKGLRDDKPTGRRRRRARSAAPAARSRNRDKLLFPQTGFTKGDLIAYYARIAPTLLPHLRDRPLTLRRWPDGVEGRPFYEKHCAAHRPDWVETASVYSSSERRRIDYCLVQEPATLAWLGNQAAIELHAPLHRARDPDRPTAVVFDLDPGPPAGLAACAEVALVLHGLFERLGLVSVVKTSGGKGLQVYVPLGEGAATLRADEAVRAPRRDAARAAPARARRLAHDEAAARRQGARRLEPERPAQDDRRRLLGPRARAADRLDAADVGGAARGARRRRAPARSRSTRPPCSRASPSSGDPFAPLLSVAAGSCPSL